MKYVLINVCYNYYRCYKDMSEKLQYSVFANAFHMEVFSEELAEAAARIGQAGLPVTSVKRSSCCSSVASVNGG